MTSILLIGATGKLGGALFETVLQFPSNIVSSITTISRRAHAYPYLDTPSQPTHHPIISSDMISWPSQIPTPCPEIFISALATTLVMTEDYDEQYALEHDINLAIAREAKRKGARTFVLLSTHMKGGDGRKRKGDSHEDMKTQIERDITALGFEHMVILKPGWMVGHSSPTTDVDALMRKWRPWVEWAFGETWAQYFAVDVEYFARATVRVALDVEEEIVEVEVSDALRLGKVEWEPWAKEKGLLVDVDEWEMVEAVTPGNTLFAQLDSLTSKGPLATPRRAVGNYVSSCAEGAAKALEEPKKEHNYKLKTSEERI